MNFQVRNTVLGCIFTFGVAILATGEGSAPVVEARMVLATDGVHAGSSVKAAVVAQIASGYHINDHGPTIDYLIPTELKLEPSKQVEVGEIIYPKGQLQRLAFSDAPLSVYEGKLVVRVVLQISRETLPGSYTLKGKFAYQACNDQFCLPPASVPLALTIRVVGRHVPVKRVNADVFGKSEFD